MDQFFQIAGLVFTVRDLVLFSVSAATLLVIAVVFIVSILRKQWRLFKNVAKPIIFINMTDLQGGMDVEAAILKRSGFFSTPEVSSDPRSIDLIDKQSLIVLGIGDSTNAAQFEAIYTKIKNLSKPVILYTLGNRDTNFLRDHSAVVKSYSFHTIATTPLRLISDIFTILSTFPH